MPKLYRESVREKLYLRKKQAEYKVLVAFIKKHKIASTAELKKYLSLKESELKDYLQKAQKSPTMNTIRRSKTEQLAWISFVKKKYLPSL